MIPVIDNRGREPIPSNHQKDAALATRLADAYRRADNEDRLVYPAEVLILLDAFSRLWLRYRAVVWPGLYAEIAISLQPGIGDSYEDPQEAANAMAVLMDQLQQEFDLRSADPAEVLRYARRVRTLHSNVAGCARAVARVLQALLRVRQPPRQPFGRLVHYFRVARRLQPYDGLLSGLEGRFSEPLASIIAGVRPVVAS